MPKMIEFYVRKPQNMRYKTIGDWYTKQDKETNDEVVRIETVDLGDANMNALVLLHEFVEYLLCTADGVTQEEVDEYDMENQDAQDEEELGENEDAPYHRQHMIADGVERIVASVMEVPWLDYSETVDKKYQEVDRAINERNKKEQEEAEKKD